MASFFPLLPPVDVSVTAVVAAALANFFLGWFLYGVAFAEQYKAAIEEDKNNPRWVPPPAARGVASEAAFGIVKAYVMAALMSFAGASSPAAAASLAAFVWAGLGLSVTLPHHAWADRPLAMTVLDSGSDLARLVATAVVLAAMA